MSRLEKMRARYPVTTESVVVHMQSKRFSDRVEEMVGRTQGVEQGFVLGMRDGGRLEYVWDKDVEAGSTQPDMKRLRRRRMVPVLYMHAHPGSEMEREALVHVPSGEDLVPVVGGWEMEDRAYPIAVGAGLVVPGGRTRTWIWQTPPEAERKVEKVWSMWNASRYEGKLSEVDIEALVEDLRYHGVNVGTEVVTAEEAARSLAHLVQGLGIKFGF